MELPIFGDVTYILVGIILLLLAFYVHCQSITGVWEKCGVPGPKPTPILYHKEDLKEGPGPALEKWEKQYGRTFGVYNFEKRGATLVTSDAELLNNILVTDFTSFADRDYITTTKSTVIDGLFFQNGSTWRRNRRILSAMFTGGKLRYVLNHVNTSASNFAKFIVAKKEKRQLVPVKLSSARYTSDVIAKTGFGVDVEALTKEDSEFFYHIEHFFTMGKPWFVFFYSLAKYFPFLMKIAYNLSDRVDPIVPEAENHFVGLAKAVIADKKAKKAEGSAEKVSKNEMDMMDLLLEAEAEDDRPLTADDNVLSMKDIIGNSSILILAGFETTSTLLQSLFYALARYPEIQDKVIEEIDRVMGDKEQPDYDSLKQLKYMEQVINEALRMFPPSPNIARKCLETRKYGSITIPKGCCVYIPIFRIHRDPEYWPDPNTFDPERFSLENKGSFPPAAFLPFGFGPRQCVAKRLALIEVKSALCHILNKMKFVLTDETEPKKGCDVKQHLHYGFLIPEKPIELDVVYRK